MSITVNGLEVRSDEIKPDISLKFSNLTQQGQIRLFSENKDTFLYEALISEYPEVHMLAINSKKEYSATSVNNLISNILKSGMTTIEAGCILELINVPNFKLEEALRKKLSNSEYWPVKAWVAKDKYTSMQLLERMFLIEATNFIKNGSTIVLNAVIQNKNFNITPLLIKRMNNIFSEEDFNKIMRKVHDFR